MAPCSFMCRPVVNPLTGYETGLTEEYIRIFVPRAVLLEDLTLLALHHTDWTDLHKSAIEGRAAGACVQAG